MAERRRGRPPHADVLTPTEWSIVDAVRHGMSDRVIAKLRGISRNAVKGIRGGRFVEAQHVSIVSEPRRAERCAVGRDAIDQLRVANRDHERHGAAVAFAEQAGLPDSNMLEQADDVVGVLLDGERPCGRALGDRP